jgi:hypothetical protein
MMTRLFCQSGRASSRRNTGHSSAVTAIEAIVTSTRRSSSAPNRPTPSIQLRSVAMAK